MKNKLPIRVFAGLWLLCFCSPNFASEATIDVSGVWNVSVVVPDRTETGVPRFELNQMGSAIGGIYRGEFGERPVIGRIDGDEVELNFSFDTPDQPIQVEYRGLVTGSQIQGTVVFGDVTDGTFTAVRAP